MPIHTLSQLARWPLTAAALLALLLAARSGRAQTPTLYNDSGGTLYQGGDMYNAGTVQNAGNYVPAAGTLLIAGGDFINTGPIGSGSATGKVQLLESSATAGHLLTLSGQALPNLTLDVPANTTLGSNGAVAGVVSLLNGHLLTSPSAGADYTLTLGAAATLAGETNAHYVKGRVAQARNLSGSTAIDFGNMGFTLNSAGNSYPLNVERRAGLLRAGVSYGVNPNVTANQGIDRVWALSSTTATTPAATMTLSWLSADDHGLTFAGTNAQVWRSDDNGSTWARQGGVQDGTGRTVTVAITRLNALYTVSTTAVPLPVTLVAFTAARQGADGLLSWQTASEKNSAYFEVQASPDARAWQALGQVAAAGTSASAHAYRYLDRTIARYGVPVVYYRLRQVDADGSATFSPVVTLSPEAEALAWQVSAYPNPYEADLTAQLITAEAGPITVTMLDAAGRVVLRREVAGRPGRPGRQIIALDDAPTVATGAYTLLVRQNAHTGTLHVVRK